MTILELSQEFGVAKSNARNWVVKNGFTPILVRTPESRGQSVHALTREEAESVRALRAQQGYGGLPVVGENGDGWFYIVQVAPDLNPLRVKLGFATDVQGRLASHRCVSPTAAIVKSWPCKRTWELAAIASATRKGCRFIGNEVFDCESLEDLIGQVEAFFAVMPIG